MDTSSTASTAPERATKDRSQGWWVKLYIPEILRGLATSLKRFFRPAATYQYPETPPPLPVRFRGQHRLKKDDKGREKCVACFMCATACPAECITIVAEEAPAEWWDDAKSPGESGRDKRPKVFTIDLLKCIYCGMCEEACPCDAIELTTKPYQVHTNRADFILDKQALLEN